MRGVTKADMALAKVVEMLGDRTFFSIDIYI